MDNKKMIEKLFRSIDQMNVDDFCSFLTDDARFKFGNGDPVESIATIREFVGGFFSAISGISHKIDSMIENGELLACRGEVTYTRKDSTSLTVPFANFFQLSDGLIADYQIYADTSMLFQ